MRTTLLSFHKREDAANTSILITYHPTRNQILSRLASFESALVFKNLDPHNGEPYHPPR